MSLFNKAASLQVFEFCEFLRITFLQNTFDDCFCYLKTIYLLNIKKLIVFISRGCYLKSINIKRNPKSKHKLIKQTRLVFSQLFDLHENLGNLKEKPTRKTYFSREKRRLTPRCYAPLSNNCPNL